MLAFVHRTAIAADVFHVDARAIPSHAPANLECKWTPFASVASHQYLPVLILGESFLA